MVQPQEAAGSPAGSRWGSGRWDSSWCSWDSSARPGSGRAMTATTASRCEDQPSTTPGLRESLAVPAADYRRPGASAPGWPSKSWWSSDLQPHGFYRPLSGLPPLALFQVSQRLEAALSRSGPRSAAGVPAGRLFRSPAAWTHGQGDPGPPPGQGAHEAAHRSGHTGPLLNPVPEGHRGRQEVHTRRVREPSASSPPGLTSAKATEDLSRTSILVIDRKDGAGRDGGVPAARRVRVSTRAGRRTHGMAGAHGTGPGRSTGSGPPRGGGHVVTCAADRSRC